jgi:ABC-type branched-subunit amino acid transport system ATPase component
MTLDDHFPDVILRCANLSKTFGGCHALADIDLAFPGTGITAIIGPNGAGKTTLLNILSGFVSADNGKCFLGTREITLLQPHQIARLGIARTFQHPRLVRRVSVLENVLVSFANQTRESLLPALLHSGVGVQELENGRTAIQLLKFVGLEQNASKAAGELSYGQQKLLALACCLATGAKILLLDEPVAGVHPGIVARILDLLRELRREGKQIIFIEHDILAVRESADFVVVLDHGKVIAQGLPRNVLDQEEIIEAYLS